MSWLAVVVEIDDAFEQHVAQIVHAVFVECAVFGHEVFEPIEAAAEALVVDFGVGGGAGGGRRNDRARVPSAPRRQDSQMSAAVRTISPVSPLLSNRRWASVP